MRGKLANLFKWEKQWLRRAPNPQTYADFFGRKLFVFLLTAQGISAFALITLAVIFRKSKVAPGLIRSMTRREIFRVGVRLLPMYLFVAFALGFVVIGQTVVVATRLGAFQFVGAVMVTVIVREFGPLLSAVLALARVGAANVIELGTGRALGHVEALEASGIDPIHYLVVPRVIGMTLSVFSLTVYLILTALASGYLVVFLQNVSVTPGNYFAELAKSLGWQDFVVLALKSCTFGFFISIVTCYHGLAQPLQLEDVARVTVRAATECIVVCVLIDALFLFTYLRA